jgi:hypothetical protein
MSVLEVLRKHKAEVNNQIDLLKKQLKQIDVAINAVVGAGGQETTVQPQLRQPHHSMPVDEAILMAISGGNTTPMTILNYIVSQLGINTTINSVRTRVSRLKSEGKITNGVDGWVIAVANDLPPDSITEMQTAPDVNQGAAANFNIDDL